MYLIELFIKKFQKKKQEENSYNPLIEEKPQGEYERCEHIFMPIDSTGEVLACSLCGMVVHKNDLKKKNIFASGKINVEKSS